MAEIKIELKAETKELYERLLGIVHCSECKWYDPPHIEYKDGTRKDYPKEPFVTFDIGTTVGGKCMANNEIYCTAHDREDPDDYEDIVMFRHPDDFCSYGEKKENSNERMDFNER